MIVRPSPHKRPPTDGPPSQWPPKSPFQAFVSSPGGRRKWQEVKEKLRDPSPSPTRRRTRDTQQDFVHKINTHIDGQSDNDFSERVNGETTVEQDESELQLQLQILETKKKLRDIQKSKARSAHGETGSEYTGSMRSGNSSLRSISPNKRQKLPDGCRPRTHVEVPVSPTKILKDRMNAPISPAKARLGLTNKAADVSLKRFNPAAPRPASVIAPAQRDAPALDLQPRAISSFGQRLADLKRANTDKQVKSDRLDSIRNKTFGAKAQKNEAPQAHEVSYATRHAETSYLSPEEMLSAERRFPTNPLDIQRNIKQPKKIDKRLKNRDFYDPFSQLHLDTRKITHADLAQALAGSEIYTIPRLLKEMKAPSYEAPDCESDYVVFGIIAEKSSPFQSKATSLIHDKHDRPQDAVSMKAPRSKFMVLKLCDLKWEVDCFLFGTGFDKYWKLTEGSLIAILNPSILPPKGNLHSGKFSLKIASSDDCIIEIGSSRDISRCTAMRKDNQPCTSWTNKTKAELCDFHASLLVNKARRGRMEVNTMWYDDKPTKRSPPKRKHNPNIAYNHEHGLLWTSRGTSAASILDDEDKVLKRDDEASRLRIAAAQRERDLFTKLSSGTGGVAGEYFRSAYGNGEEDLLAEGTEVRFIKPTAAELGLLGKTASSQRLSPAKDRRRHFGIGAIGSAGTTAMGWGGAGKAGLLNPKPKRQSTPERGQTRLNATVKPALSEQSRGRSLSPRKKARFNLAQGIKTPGRESGAQIDFMADDNDDDLDIV